MNTLKSFLFYSLISLFVYSLIGLIHPPPVYAKLLECVIDDPNWKDVTIPCVREEYRQGREGGVNSGTNYDVANQKLMLSAADLISGVVSYDGTEKTLPFLHNSALGKLGSSITMMYQNPPADTRLWIADTGATLGFLPKPAYAQGLGFSGLSLLLPIWKAFRNLSYFLLAVVMVVIGFMVMFRKKIDPKTVVTVQNALPRIVMTLILITFSYAIVGLLIDAMYLVMIVVIGMLVSTSNGVLNANTVSEWTSSSFWVVIKGYVGSFRAIDDFIRFLAPNDVAGTQIAAPTWGIITYVLQFATAVVGAALFILLIVLAVLFMLIRIFFMLLNAYIHIIISLLIGPFQILLDVFPGGVGFSSWVLNLISNLIVFPITAFMILIGNILMASNLPAIWTPPLLGTGGQGAVALIGLGILMVIPGVVNGIKESMKAKPPIGAGPGAVMAPISGVWQIGQGALSQFYYGAQLKHMFWPKKEDK
ncbi:hypothetical protein HY409_01775 [Candidatus Gottesmanbacteria bacterium]|nr:hypothetical protein [Candidatus Gottesmanbacteria bacterium]